MELQIDYLKNNEQVYIENKASGDKLVCSPSRGQ